MNRVERLFDMICHVYDGKEESYKMKDAELPAKKLQAFIGKQLHESVVSSYTKVDESTAIQAFTGSTDLAKITTNVWNAFQATPDFDMFWQSVFRTVPLRKGQLEWSIGNVTSGTTLKILEEGAKVDYESISGSVVKGSVDLYGSGLSMSWHTIEGRDLAGFYNAMTDFRAKRMVEYADVHYGLLATAGATNQVTYQAGTSVLDKDIATINLGYYTIANACKGLGFGDTANARQVMFVSPNLKGRIEQALKATSDTKANSDGSVVYGNITVYYTFNSNIPANKALMVLPQNKIQNAVYMQERSFERTDPDNLNMLKSSFTAFGAIVGENDQVAEVAFA